METKIFVNLHVQNLERSKRFYEQLGFSINLQFSDENAACVVISDHIYVMIITHGFFQQFTPKAISDAHNTTEVLNSLELPGKAEVDNFMNTALAAGATEARDVQDLGFMYSRSFNDPDGHIWEVFWMDLSAMPQA
ncbi:MAG: VOC family protein [Saprospiraceae bacterium]